MPFPEEESDAPTGAPVVSAEGEAAGSGSLDTLSPRRRRRLIAIGTIRTLATVAVLVGLYYLLPLDQSGRVKTVTELVVGIVIVALVVWWQVHRILGSPYPLLRGVEALAFTVPLFLLLFAVTYYLMDRALASSFTQHLTRTDALYFTVTVFTTVGFGDISAKSEAARLVVTSQMILDLLVVGIVVRLILQAVKLNQQRRPAPSPGGDNAATR
jgi:voltage-gated potassium channel